MLMDHLQAKTSPRATEENCVFFENYRVTVLSDRLFRIEEHSERRFSDAATLSVWFRNAEKQSFTSHTADAALTVTTAAVSLTVDRDFARSYVTLDGDRVALSNEGNLLGTARTLDCYDGSVYIRDGSSLLLDNGVCSRTGVAILDDTGTLRLSENGEPIPPHDSIRDIYVFAFGKDYRAAVRALYFLCGPTPMLPRFALGNWWSRFHKYTDEEYLHLMRAFAEQDIPLSVATVDVDWHYSSNVDAEFGITAAGKNTADRGCEIPAVPSRLGWTGYTWNKNLFPDHKDFMDRLHAQKLRVSLNLHPHSGVRYFEEQYKEMATAMGIDPACERAVEFDIEDTRFVNSYFSILHNPYEREGVDFWWIDWQQGTTSKSIGLDPLWALNHYHFLDLAKSRALPLIVSRYAGVGSHRYPVGFSGDTTISWATLELLPRFTATASNIGYTWWGHDIGGHHLGLKDDELYLRFLQFGVFSPMNRMHCTDSVMISKEPWIYENGSGELAARMLRLRHAMIPFLYTCNHLTHSCGKALIEPMYYEYPELSQAYAFRDQYLFGGLLVAPITRHSEHKGLTVKQVWVPEGRWTDIFTGDVYIAPVGGRVFDMVRPLDSIPVLAKEGTVLPLSQDRGNSTKNPEQLEVRVFVGNGTYSLYEDSATEDNTLTSPISAAFTDFRVESEPGCCRVSVSTRGDRSVLPENRSLRLVFPNIVSHSAADTPEQAIRRNAVQVCVTENGKEIPCEVDAYREARITLARTDAAARYEITLTYDEPTPAELRRREVATKLMRTQCPFNIKRKLNELLADRKRSLEEIYNHICISDLEEIDKKRLCETFDLPF